MRRRHALALAAIVVVASLTLIVHTPRSPAPQGIPLPAIASLARIAKQVAAKEGDPGAAATAKAVATMFVPHCITCREATAVPVYDIEMRGRFFGGYSLFLAVVVDRQTFRVIGEGSSPEESVVWWPPGPRFDVGGFSGWP